MRDSSSSKRRFYQNKKIQDINNSGSINLEKNNINGLKKSSKEENGQKSNDLKIEKLEIFTKFSIKKTQKSLITEYENENNLIKERKDNPPPHSRIFYKKKNCYSKDLTYNNDTSLSNSYLNKSNK